MQAWSRTHTLRSLGLRGETQDTHKLLASLSPIPPPSQIIHLLLASKSLRLSTLNGVAALPEYGGQELSALYLAILQNQEAVVAALIERGADFSAVDVVRGAGEGLCEAGWAVAVRREGRESRN